MTHGSLFSGIGGFDLAAEWMGWENVFHCEKDEFGQRVLNYYFPKSIHHEDITKTDFTIYRGRIDILSGGFPCQPYSQAGKRLGKEDDRHLWPEMCRAIREIQPPWIVGENVFGLVNWNNGVVFEEVQVDLESEGYEVQSFVLPASGVDAPHQRHRVFIIAYSDRYDDIRRSRRYAEEEEEERIRQSDQVRVPEKSDQFSPETETSSTDTNDSGAGIGLRTERERQEAYQGRERQPQPEPRQDGIYESSTDTDRGLSDDENQTLCSRWKATHGGGQGAPANAIGSQRPQGRSNPVGPGETGRYTSKRNPWESGRKWEDFPTQPPVCNGDDGISARLDGITFSKWRTGSIKAGGNAVVPPLILNIFKTIEEYEYLKTGEQRNSG